MKYKLFRITTVPISMDIILKGQLAFMNKYFDVTGITGNDENHFNKIQEREGISMKSIEMTRTISPLKDIKSLVQLFIYFLKEKPDIVHTHSPKAGLLGMFAAYFARVPFRLHTVAGMPLMEQNGIKRSILNFIEKITYLCANKVYPNSFGLKEFILKEKFCKPDKLKVIANGGSNGINIDFFSPNYNVNINGIKNELRNKLSISDDDLVFCFIGRLAKEKGINELIEAFIEVRKFHKIKLILVGPYEEKFGVLDVKVKEVIDKNIDILYLGRFDDVRPFYSISDVNVFPSYREGFPNTLLEAGAMGLPSIASNINGCNEIIIHNINGLLIEPKDMIQLKTAMLKMIEDKLFRQKLASCARLNIISKFNREIIWENLLKEYSQLLSCDFIKTNVN